MIHFNNVEHGKLIAKAIPRPFNPRSDIVISHSQDGKLLGGVILEGYTGAGGSICAHQAGFSKHWLSRDMLWAAFHYPFEQLKVKKILGAIPSSNPKLLELNTKLGFKVEAPIRDGYPGGDMLVMSMTRPDCRWLSITPKTLRSNK